MREQAFVRRSFVGTVRGELAPCPLVALVTALMLTTYTDVNDPSKNPCSIAPPGIVGDRPTGESIGGGSGGLAVCFSRCVILRGTSRGIMISPPRVRVPRVHADKGGVRVVLRSALGGGAACAMSFSSTVMSGGRKGPVKGFACSFSAKAGVSAVRISKAVLRTRGLRPVGNVVIKLCTSLSSATFAARPFSEISHAGKDNGFGVGKITPKGCHVCTLRSVSTGFVFDRGTRGVTFSAVIVRPSYHPSAHRSAI